jgi:glycosyltransferase involved in cell wall biosynthesis
VAALRAELGLSDQPVVLYSGNFEPYQGVGLLAEAAARAKEAQFLFMGGEPMEIDALRAQAASSGARCVFSGKRPPAELPVFLALADVLVSPRTQGENTPFKIYTYLSSGKPLVATRLPTHTQLLDDGVAFLVDPTPEGLAVGIRRALADRGDAAARALRGRHLIEREYSPARYAEKVERAYEAVAAAIGPKPASL